DRSRALRGAHDRVLRRELTEVDTRLELTKFTIARDARLNEHGQAIRLTLVSVRRHHTEPVRVHDRVVVPPARTLTRLVELTQSNDGVLHLTVDLVTVHIEVRGELVELPHLLELAERVSNESRVNDADVRRRRRII